MENEFFFTHKHLIDVTRCNGIIFLPIHFLMERNEFLLLKMLEIPFIIAVLGETAHFNLTRRKVASLNALARSKRGVSQDQAFIFQNGIPNFI